MSHLNRLQLLKESWNIVAQRYRQEFVPRFRPWVNDAIDALIAQSPPPSGIVFVPGKLDYLFFLSFLIQTHPPTYTYLFHHTQQHKTQGVGTGDEICALAQKLPNYDYYGVDLSDTMIEIAKEVCKDINTNVTLAVGDASSTADAVLHPGNINNNNTKNTKVAAVFSCFTLQQLPNPREALANWASLLGGEGTVMVVLFWPTNVEEKGGPWQLVAQLCPPQRMNVRFALFVHLYKDNDSIKNNNKRSLAGWVGG